uniref:Uncharacterized protein n=1 Tax=Timema poppense TaxID=170557 RepID=A0A7R9DUR9_TIMPO|nr:unnamed protein product [Timema poppensis]
MLGIKRVEFRSVPTFAWRESGKLFRKKTHIHITPRLGSKPNLPIFKSLVYCVTP